MPYYACMECGVLHWDGKRPDECSVCEDSTDMIATFNINDQ